MKHIVLCLAFLFVAGCGSGQDLEDSPGSTVDRQSLSTELACGQFVAIHADIDPDFEGYETPEEALDAWSGLPDGEWIEHESRTWLLVNSDGETVGRSSEMLMVNAERYVSTGVEYCE